MSDVPVGGGARGAASCTRAGGPPFFSRWRMLHLICSALMPAERNLSAASHVSRATEGGNFSAGPPRCARGGRPAVGEDWSCISFIGGRCYPSHPARASKNCCCTRRCRKRPITALEALNDFLVNLSTHWLKVRTRGTEHEEVIESAAR